MLGRVPFLSLVPVFQPNLVPADGGHDGKTASGHFVRCYRYLSRIPVSLVDGVRLMDSLGMLLGFVIIWFWANPETAGRWLAKMRNAHDEWIDDNLGGDHE